MRLLLWDEAQATIVRSWQGPEGELIGVIHEFSQAIAGRLWLVLSRLNENREVLDLIKKCEPHLAVNDIVHISPVATDHKIFMWPMISSYNWQFLPNHCIGPSNCWKVSADFYLIRLSVFQELNLLSDKFSSWATALSELSFRALRRGAMVKRLHGFETTSDLRSSIMDELLFARIHLGRSNFRMLCFFQYMNPKRWWEMTAVLLRQPKLVSASLESSLLAPLPSALLYKNWNREVGAPPRYTAIIPTILRYDYLQKSINSLLFNAVPPDEIIVVDQTPKEKRVIGFYEQFGGQVRVFYLDEPGQCTSRNLAIREAKNDWLLLFEDDAEAWPEMVSEHWKAIALVNADASTGVSLAPWKDVSYIPTAKRFAQLSDVFATGNCFARKRAIEEVGGLHLAFNRGSGADDDLGKRMYLSGSTIVFNPKAIETHHKAPSGGMRIHGSWWRTKTSFNKEYPPATHLFAIRKYYPLKSQITLVIMNIIKGFLLEKGLRKLIFIVLLPYRFTKAVRLSSQLFTKYESRV
jgi:GT2 family glycosyltransferase